MTPEIETVPPAAGSNSRIGSGTTITCVSDNTRKSSARNRGRGHGRESCKGRGGHQGRDRRVRCFNRPSYTSLIGNFKGEVENFSAFLGTTAKQREAKYQYKNFREKLKRYILQ